METILSKYANRKVNPKYYGTIKISGEAKETKYLTREELKAGKPGFVLLDNKTGKIVFDDERRN